jgi:hypothetical protein
MSGWRREASYHCLSRRRRKLEPSVSNRRLFFLMPSRFGLKIQPRGRFLANEEVDVHELLRF